MVHLCGSTGAPTGGRKVGWSEIARHRGYAILVFAWSPLGENTFMATYNILGHYGRSKAVLFQGVVAGAYQSAEAAQEAATERAKKWIDEQ